MRVPGRSGDREEFVMFRFIASLVANVFYGHQGAYGKPQIW